MGAQFQARCFACLAGDALALTKEPKRAIYWEGEHALYYSENLLYMVGERLELAFRYAERWDEFRHFGDVPTQKEILTYMDVLVRDPR